MKKRAVIPLVALIEITLGIVIFGVFTSAAYSYSSGEAGFKARTAKEIANEIAVLCSLDGNAEISFPGMPKLTLEAKNDIISIYSQKYGNIDPSIGKAEVSKPDCIGNYIISSPKSLKLVKKEGKVIFEYA